MKNALLEVKEFAVHVFVGTAMFLLLAVSAVFIGVFAHWVNSIHHNTVIATGLLWIEYMIFGVDSTMFLIYIINSVIKSIRTR